MRTPKKLVLSEEQIKTLKQLAEQGASKTQIANTLGFCKDLTNRFLKEFNVVLTPSPRNRAGKKLVLSKEQIETLKQLAGQGATKREIAETLGFGKNLTKRFLKESDISLTPSPKNRSGQKIVLSEEQMATFKQLAFQGATKQKIADTLCISRKVVTRILKEFNIVLTPSIRNQTGKKFEWTPELESKLKALYASKDIKFCDIHLQFGCSEATISNKAKELGLKKAIHPIKEISEEEVDFIKSNLGKISVKEMTRILNRCDESIERVIKELGLKNTFKSAYSRRIPMPEDPDFLSALSNPAYSNVYLSHQYGYSQYIIRKWRKILYGNRKAMIDTYLNKSSAEIQFEKFLDDLNLVYSYNYEIDNWVIDYNLGFNLLIEIQGDYWHGKIDKAKKHAKIEKTVAKDKRKLLDLTQKGYLLIAIWESELSDETAVKEKVLKALYGQINSYFNGSLNLVNS